MTINDPVAGDNPSANNSPEGLVARDSVMPASDRELQGLYTWSATALPLED
jgi:hypothetical protein